MPNASSIEIANVTVSQFHVFSAPLEIATDPIAGTIYLGDYSSNNLTVVNATTYAVIGRISLLGLPGNGISVDSRNDLVYVPIAVCTNETASMNNCPGGSRVRQVAVIDGKNYSVIGEIQMALSLLTFDSRSGVMFASQTGTSFLLGINPQSGAIVANVTIGDIYSIAVNQFTDMVYAETCTSGSASCDGEVEGVNASSGEMRFSVPMPYFRVANLVVDSTTDTVYALGNSPAVELLALDGASGAMRYLSILAGCNIYSGTALSVAYNPALEEVYVISNAWLMAVYAETGHLAYVLGVPGAWSAAVSPDGLRIYLAMAPASLANTDTGYLLVIPAVAADETYVTNFAQEGCHAP